MKKLNLNYPNISVLMVGADLTSNGGIASVVKSYYKSYKKKGENINLELLKIGYYKDKNFFFEFKILIKSFFIYLNRLFSNKYNIIHIHSSGGIGFYRASIFVIFGKIFRQKIIIHLHASNFYEFFITKNFVRKKYINFIFNLVNIVIVLCNDWKIKIHDLYNLSSIVTIFNPINIGEYSVLNHAERKSTSNLKILFMGFIIESKGVFDIIKLAKCFKEKNISDIKLIIAGKGELEAKLREKIDANQLGDIVDFIGWVDQNDKRSILNSVDVFFLPSYKEGLPISILEAMAVGLPIVSTNISGIPEAVKHGFNGYLYKPGSIESYYDTFLDFLKNPEKLYVLGKNSLERVKKFDSNVIYDKLIKIYRGLQCESNISEIIKGIE